VGAQAADDVVDGEHDPAKTQGVCRRVSGSALTAGGVSAECRCSGESDDAQLKVHGCL